MCIQFYHSFTRLLADITFTHDYITVKVYANIHFCNIRNLISNEYIGDYISIYVYMPVQGRSLV